MNNGQKDDSGFVFGIVVGAVIGAVVAIVIHQQDKDEVIKQLKNKIDQIFNPRPSRRQKIKTNQLIVKNINQSKSRSVKKPKTFIGAKRS